MFKISKYEFNVLPLIAIGVLIYLLPLENIVKCAVFTILNFILILHSLYKENKNGNILTSISIANIFLLCVFVLRATQIIYMYPFVDDIYVIGMYQKLFGNINVENLPFDKASAVGFFGTAFLNLAYFRVKLCAKRNSNKKNDRINNNIQFFSYKQVGAIFVCLIPAILSLMSFFMKASISRQSVSLIDLAWLYIFSSLIIFIIYKKRKANVLVYILICASIFILSILAKRQYIVNLLICYIVPVYYYRKNSRDVLKIIIMGLSVVLVILFYGQIRAEMISATTGSSLNQLMNEFCMYDMLVISIKKLNDINYGLFYGYNFLTIFTTPISSKIITQFDHELTNIIFNGLFKGGIPVTILGSLYLNFSFVGVIIGSVILGRLFAFFDKLFLNNKTSKGIMYYTMLITFVYDIVRVGDIGREVWTFFIAIFVCYVFCKIVPDTNIKTKCIS